MARKFRTGNYKIVSRPTDKATLAVAVTWRKIEALAKTKPHGIMTYDELCEAAKDHKSGSKTRHHPYQFINYAIDNVKWLSEVQE